jgi:hypothetical protein
MEPEAAERSFPSEASVQIVVLTILFSFFPCFLALLQDRIRTTRLFLATVRLTMSLPQPLHISAAFALVESKPKHMTIQGTSLLELPETLSNLLLAYIQILRDSIESIRQDDQILRRLNLSTFWQNQHDDLHKTLEKERDATFVLQEEREALQTQITQLEARSKPGRKRKSAEQEEPKTTKKMRAGTIAITEFGSAVDVDPGSTSQTHVEFSADLVQLSKPCGIFTDCRLCAGVACGALTPMSWPTTSCKLCKRWV